MKRHILSAAVFGGLVFVLAAAPAPATRGHTWSKVKQSRLETLVRPFLVQRQPRSRPIADSVSIAIGTDHGLLATAAFGDAAPGLAATPSTVYRIGSLTKPFTAFATLKLLDQRARSPAGNPLSLNTPLNEIFRDVDHWRTRDGKVFTLLNLLTMTSTLPNLTSQPPYALDPWGAAPASHILGALKASYPRRVANTFEYSNTNYFLLSEIIDKILMHQNLGSQNYRQYLRQTLLAPAGLSHTWFVGETLPDAVWVAKPHYRKKPAFALPDWLKGSADMLGTATDVYKMNKALLGGSFLSEKMTKLMFAELNRVSPFEWYGMGWFVRDGRNAVAFSHSGSVPGFTSYNRVTRKKDDGHWLAVTILTNNTDVEGLDILASDIERLVGEP